MPGETKDQIRTQGLLKAHDGTSIYYEVRGAGRPLIFCYGLVCRIEHWRHQIRYFSNRYKVVTFDYRGHHRSGFPANDRHFTLEWCARDVGALIEHLGLSEAVCLGHSMGVPVLTYTAGFEPEKIKGLVFVCGSVNNPFGHMFHSDKMNQVFKVSSYIYEVAPLLMTKLWKRFTNRNRIGYFIASRFGFNPTLAEKDDVLLYMDGVSQIPLPIFQSLLNDYTRFDGRELLKHIRCPTLVIAGGKDFITPAIVQEEMAKQIAGSVFELIPEGSHNAHMDLPRVVNEKIENFLERLDYR